MLRAARARIAIIALVSAAFLPASAAAQRGAAPKATPAKTCLVDVKGVVTRGEITTHTVTYPSPGGNKNTFTGGGVDARCGGTDQRLRSDSAEHYGDEKRLILIGHVHYTESRVRLDSDRMTYYTTDERLVAEGNVRGVTNTGTRFTGPRAEYLRASRGVRDRSRLTADSRPNVWLSPTDAGTKTADSTNLQADLVISDNDSLIYAKGKVVISRPDLSSTSDSAFMDNGKEFVRLSYTPKIVGKGERKFTLDGDVIDAWSKRRKVQRVESMGHAHATSDEVLLSSDTIDLRITEEKLSRAYAWGPSRARAKSKDQDLTADSIDVRMPAQVLREMFAVRNARALSTPDTVHIVSTEPDWLTGDLIVASFDSVAAGDTLNKPAVRKITATGSPGRPAASYYQASSGGTKRTDCPNYNYVTGQRVVVDFSKGEVDSVTVKGKANGLYMECAADSTRSKAAPDSAKRRAPQPIKPAGRQP